MAAGGSLHVSDVCDPDRWRESFAWGHILGYAFAVAPGATPAEINLLKQETIGYLPDRTVEWQIRAALSELESKIHIRLGVSRVMTEPLDTSLTLVRGVDYDRVREPIPFVRAMAEQFLRIDVGEPLISIQRIRAQFHGSISLDLSTASELAAVKVVNRAAGTFHLIPSAGHLEWVTATGDAPFLVSSRFRPWHYGHSSRTNTLPAVWLVDYTTGPIDGSGNAGMLDAALVNWVWARAGVMLFSLSGIAQGGGIASTSISVDGISRSIGTTASAMYGLNSAFEKVLDDYQKSIDWAYWRRKYSGITVGLY